MFSLFCAFTYFIVSQFLVAYALFWLLWASVLSWWATLFHNAWSDSQILPHSLFWTLSSSVHIHSGAVGSWNYWLVLPHGIWLLSFNLLSSVWVLVCCSFLLIVVFHLLYTSSYLSGSLPVQGWELVYSGLLCWYEVINSQVQFV